MTLTAVWSDGYLLHDAGWLLWAGARLDGDEERERAEVLRSLLEESGIAMIHADEHGRGPIDAVHHPGMVDYLETAYEDWVEAGYPEYPGSDRVVPYVFPHPAAFGRYPARHPRSRAAMAGVYCIDTATVIGPGTYAGARAAVDGALTGARLLVEGKRAVYAPVRPPGHHAGSSYFGGSCYLNSVAVAAQWLVAETGGKAAVVDIDAHHGNGTQEIFYEREEVFYASFHVDPGEGWFPHWCGFAEETGEGPGRGTTLNLPLRPGSGDQAVVAAVDRAGDAVSTWGPDLLVVSLGVDAGASDPESPLQVTNAGFTRVGELLAAMGLPTLLVQEGGYDLAALARDVGAVLSAFAAPS